MLRLGFALVLLLLLTWAPLAWAQAPPPTDLDGEAFASAVEDLSLASWATVTATADTPPPQGATNSLASVSLDRLTLRPSLFLSLRDLEELGVGLSLSLATLSDAHSVWLDVALVSDGTTYLVGISTEVLAIGNLTGRVVDRAGACYYDDGWGLYLTSDLSF